jgi:predicted small secreted protein
VETTTVESVMDVRRLIVWLYLGISAVSGLALAGCHTVEGFGRDVEAAGDAIEDAANDD